MTKVVGLSGPLDSSSRQKTGESRSVTACQRHFVAAGMPLKVSRFSRMKPLLQDSSMRSMRPLIEPIVHLDVSWRKLDLLTMAQGKMQVVPYSYGKREGRDNRRIRRLRLSRRLRGSRRASRSRGPLQGCVCQAVPGYCRAPSPRASCAQCAADHLDSTGRPPWIALTRRSTLEVGLRKPAPRRAP